MLSDLDCRSAKAREKDYKLYDSDGLFLLVTKTGTRLWKFKYRFHNKEKKLSFGTYPYLSLADARKKREEAKQIIHGGIDPTEKKQEEL